jgi:hypothetical protein
MYSTGSLGVPDVEFWTSKLFKKCRGKERMNYRAAQGAHARSMWVGDRVTEKDRICGSYPMYSNLFGCH